MNDADTFPVGNSMEPALQVTSSPMHYRLIIQQSLRNSPIGTRLAYVATSASGLINLGIFVQVLLSRKLTYKLRLQGVKKKTILTYGDNLCSRTGARTGAQLEQSPIHNLKQHSIP